MEEQTNQITNKNNKLSQYRTVIIVVLALILAVFFFFSYQREKANNPARELEQVLKTISKVMELPAEKPQLAKVTDETEFQKQGLFSQAINNDIVLIYAEEQKAILYRPSTKKVIDIISIKPVETQQIQQVQEEPVIEAIEASATVTLYNGSKIGGITQEAEKKLIQAGVNIIVENRDIASSGDYQDSLVVDLTGNNAEKALQVAETLSAKVGVLPEGESKPNTDLLVIIGNNFQ